MNINNGIILWNINVNNGTIFIQKAIEFVI